jgi:hypothetical protein
MYQLPLPTSFSSQNTFRLVHQISRPETSQLPEMTADAIGHLRAFTDAINTLPANERHAMPPAMRDLARFALRGDILAPEALGTGAAVLRAIDERIETDEASSALIEIAHKLRNAIRTAQRVFDLILAEHQVACLRCALAEPDEDEE